MSGDDGFTTNGTPPTEIDPMSLGLPLVKRRRLNLLLSGDNYRAPRSLWDIIPPRDLGRLPIFPRSTILINNQEVENDDDNGTSAEQG